MTGTLQYRVYTIGRDGHIVRADAMECRGDDEAIERTEQLVDGHDLELWSGPTFIRRFKSKDPAP